MSSIKTVLVEDSKISDITEELTYGVKSFASQSTFQPYQATSVSKSNINFSIQVPSESIVIDREILIQADMTLKLSYTGVPAGDKVMQYGKDCSMAAFPINSLFLTTQCTINNANVSENTQDVMAMLLNMYDKRELQRYNSMTPSFVDDCYGDLADAVNSTNNPMGSILSSSLDSSFMGRGAFPVEITVVHYENGVGTPDDSLVSVSEDDTWDIYIKGTYTEPFLALSPWLNSLPTAGKAGFMGINNMSFILNLDSECKRVFSTGNSEVVGQYPSPKYLTGISLTKADNSTGLDNVKLLMNFLSLSPEQMGRLSGTKNVVPYLTYPRFLSNANQNSPIAAGAKSVALTSQSIQLSSIPDKIMIGCRIPMAQQNSAIANAFLAIKGISVTFNNASGLLSTASQQDLFSKVSYPSGSSQNFTAFSGNVLINDAVTGAVENIPSIGSVLVLDPCAHFSLPSYLSAGSLGQFQFQFNLTVDNQFPYGITPELVIITVNSGVFSVSAGTSAIYTGLLTKEAVLDAKAKSPKLSIGEYDRMIGGAKNLLGMSALKIKGAGMSGGGMSGGGVSGGGMSGGMRRRIDSLM